MTDPLFLQQSLQEMFYVMAMYVVYLGLGHTLLCKTVKSKTIKRYVTEAAGRVQQRRTAYQLAHPRMTFA